ncbi:MAG: sugar isomerase [Candidatus Saccharicenans sp.]
MSRCHHHNQDGPTGEVRCCPSAGWPVSPNLKFSRRTFLKGFGVTTLSAIGLNHLSWKTISAGISDSPPEDFRRPLKVKPLLVYEIPTRVHQTSWRAWGGIQTQAEADEELGRIRRELAALKNRADFPVDFLPVSGVKTSAEIERLKEELATADVIIVYAAGGWLDRFKKLEETGKELIFFCRHRSGPVYLWYEIISPRYLRQHTDHLALDRVDDSDVVIDSQDELLWRLRGLCGWRNTVNTRIVAVGGPDAWAQPPGVVPRLVEDKWKFEIITVSYEELGRIIKEAKSDASAMKRARERAAEYLRHSGTRLETELSFVQNAFLLEEVFLALLKKTGCRALTINGCMGTIMPLAETSACLTLSLLNDAGYLAFCESDFVVIPSGVLLANISGRPVFLNDPTYPHEGIITLAHCTAPRRMDGKTLEPARILTHFESDYGAAPKVEMRKGQTVTNVIPDFAAKRWVGFVGKIEEAPFLPICRSQIEVSFSQDSQLLARKMPGFHWMTAYGDYLREVGYALRRVKIDWDPL